jgi:HK97 gp10 family phage protein
MNKIDGMDDLQKSLKKLGALPQKCVSSAARKGAKIWLNAVKARAPVDTGELKSGIILKSEKRSKKGKKVFDVEMDPAKNDVFVKMHRAGKGSSAVRNKKTKLGSETRSYYPASQEFGYFLRNGEYMPGLHFMKSGAEETATAAETVIVGELTKNIEKEWNNKNGS